MSDNIEKDDIVNCDRCEKPIPNKDGNVKEIKVMWSLSEKQKESSTIDPLNQGNQERFFLCIDCVADAVRDATMAIKSGGVFPDLDGGR